MLVQTWCAQLAEEKFHIRVSAFLNLGLLWPTKPFGITISQKNLQIIQDLLQGNLGINIEKLMKINQGDHIQPYLCSLYALHHLNGEVGVEEKIAKVRTALNLQPQGLCHLTMNGRTLCW